MVQSKSVFVVCVVIIETKEVRTKCEMFGPVARDFSAEFKGLEQQLQDYFRKVHLASPRTIPVSPAPAPSLIKPKTPSPTVSPKRPSPHVSPKPSPRPSPRTIRVSPVPSPSLLKPKTPSPTLSQK